MPIEYTPAMRDLPSGDDCCSKCLFLNRRETDKKLPSCGVAKNGEYTCPQHNYYVLEHVISGSSIQPEALVSHYKGQT